MVAGLQFPGLQLPAAGRVSGTSGESRMSQSQESSHERTTVDRVSQQAPKQGDGTGCAGA